MNLDHLLPFLFLLSSLPGLAQSIRNPAGLPYLAAGTYGVHNPDPASCLANPAAFSHLSKTAAAVYTERRFLIRELDLITCVAGIPLGSGVLGFGTGYSGFSDYHESYVAIAYAKKLGRIDLGIRLNYEELHIAGFGMDAAVMAEAGSIWHLSDKLHFGINILNPAGSKFIKSREKTASVILMGLAFEPSAQLSIAGEIIKEEDKPANIRIGFEYTIMDHLFARAGLTTGQSLPWMGIGWQWRDIRAFVFNSYHPQLGISPGLEISFIPAN